MACELKRYETRSWTHKHRGVIAIHAASKRNMDIAAMCMRSPYAELLAQVGYGRYDELPFRQVLAVADLTGIYHVEEVPGKLSAQELALGDYRDGRAAWKTKKVRQLKQPVAAKGAQGLWNGL